MVKYGTGTIVLFTIGDTVYRDVTEIKIKVNAFTIICEKEIDEVVLE